MSTTATEDETTARHRPATTDLRGPLAGLIGRRRPGYSLPAPFYTDRAVFDHDLAAIFGEHWLFVGAEPEIAEPGDYVTVQVGTSSVIVLRDDDGDVRALHNVCRHRGTRLLDDRRGSTGNIVCPYHQWTYGTDGSLLHAGQQPAGFDKSCFTIKQVAVRRIGGLIFICLAEQPPADVDEMAERITPYLLPHDLTRTRIAAQDEVIVQANWKLAMENNRECYHCEGSHPELTCVFFPTYGYAVEDLPPRLLPAHARYLGAEAALERTCDERSIPYAAIEELHGRPTGFRIQREALDGGGESYTTDGTAASTKLLGDLDTARLGRLSLHIQPNAWFHFLGDHAVVFSLLPLDVDRSVIRTTWLVHSDAVEGVDYDHDRLTDVWRKTNAQDAALCQRAQLGVTDPAYQPGPYAPNEYQVDHFIRWYLERLEHNLGREADR
ncbi:aromatic ring-hydroxylating oxygenase subunit alpha [Microlunatus soli]|uniref:Rieske 2Fe-2S family protein n=1 Tax=Microlunatus soli TaxID=630515 RepID=A0A1H1XPU5_9ACTN|nr:aromatic ring-hydroxylating dioxygenase subunit alpha [Microlunatus soli]SDT11264.1 Rieske 2Fe-2S family protein [Microlunatus soli]